MKILFLDFDGVLNDDAFYEHVHEYQTKYSLSTTDRVKRSASTHINPYNVQNLKYILKLDPEVRIVISSTWRKHFSLKDLQWILTKHGVSANKIIGKTDLVGPNEHEGSGISDIQRGDLCIRWAEQNSVTCFVCVDDDNDFDRCRDRLVRTNSKNGLIRTKAEEILKLFGSFKEKPNTFNRDIYTEEPKE